MLVFLLGRPGDTLGFPFYMERFLYSKREREMQFQNFPTSLVPVSWEDSSPCCVPLYSTDSDRSIDSYFKICCA